jgi:hypothetical protein
MQNVGVLKLSCVLKFIALNVTSHLDISDLKLPYLGHVYNIKVNIFSQKTLSYFFKINFIVLSRQ